jgi:transposase
MKKICLVKRKEILSLVSLKMPLKRIASEVGVSKSSVSRVLKESNVKFEKCLKDRKKKLSSKKESFIVKKVINNELLYASDVSKYIDESFGINISDQTVRNILKKNNLKYYKKQKKNSSYS